MARRAPSAAAPATRAAPARGAGGPQEAYVLHRYDWSESSLVIDLFARAQGRVAVVAKGAKRPYSQLRAVLLPFQRLLVQLGRPSADETAEVQNLRSAEWAGGAAMLGGAALFSGFYLNELVMKLVARGDPHAVLFDAYAAALQTLATGDERSVDPALRAFELRLLQEIGVLPDLAVVTLTQQPVAPAGEYELLPEAGVTAARPGAAALGGTALVGLQAALLHGSVPALQQACAATPPALKGVLRALLQHHLGTAPLRTRQFMRDVQNLAFLPTGRAADTP